MKKILTASFLLLLTLSFGCKGKSPAPAAAEPQATPAATPADANAGPIQKKCDQLREAYFPTQLDRLRVTVEYKAQMLEVYKKAGSVTDEAKAAVAKLDEEMQAKLVGALQAHGMNSMDDLNAKDCPPMMTAKPSLDPKATAEFSELAQKLGGIEREINALTTSAPAAPTAPTEPAAPAAPAAAPGATPAPAAPAPTTKP